MMLPKVDPEIGENVEREATRDLLKYAKDKALELNKENPALSRIVYGLAKATSKGDKELQTRIYFALLVVLNVINTQMEVNDLRESWN